MHRVADGEILAIERPNKYTGLALDERTVILKLHGAFDRDDPSATVTSSQRTAISTISRPCDVGEPDSFSLRERMADSHLLFLGTACATGTYGSSSSGSGGRSSST